MHGHRRPHHGDRVVDGDDVDPGRGYGMGWAAGDGGRHEMGTGRWGRWARAHKMGVLFSLRDKSCVRLCWRNLWYTNGAETFPHL